MPNDEAKRPGRTAAQIFDQVKKEGIINLHHCYNDCLGMTFNELFSFLITSFVNELKEASTKSKSEIPAKLPSLDLALSPPSDTAPHIWITALPLLPRNIIRKLEISIDSATSFILLGITLSYAKQYAIRELSLIDDGCDLEKMHHIPTEFLKRNRTLEILRLINFNSLDSKSTDTTVMTTLIDSVSHRPLTELTLKNCKNPDKETMAAIKRSIASSQNTLQNFDFSGCLTSAKQMAGLLSELREMPFPQLKHLNLSGNHLDAKATTALVEVLPNCRALTHLALSKCGLDKNATSALFNGLFTHREACKIETLMLEGQANEWEYRQDGMPNTTIDSDSLSQFLASDPPLSILNLIDCVLDANAKKNPFAGLSKNTHLRTMRVGGNSSNLAEQLPNLCKALQENASLTRLDMGFCVSKKNNILLFTEMLAVNQSLKFVLLNMRFLVTGVPLEKNDPTFETVILFCTILLNKNLIDIRFLPWEYVGNNYKEGLSPYIIEGIEAFLKRNAWHSRQSKNWGGIAVAMSFVRANAGNAIRHSILPLIPSILHHVSEAPVSSTQEDIKFRILLSHLLALIICRSMQYSKSEQRNPEYQLMENWVKAIVGLSVDYRLNYEYFMNTQARNDARLVTVKNFIFNIHHSRINLGNFGSYEGKLRYYAKTLFEFLSPPVLLPSKSQTADNKHSHQQNQQKAGHAASLTLAGTIISPIQLVPAPTSLPPPISAPVSKTTPTITTPASAPIAAPSLP